ncbi:MAG: glycosyltransferase [Microbacteriaceae bacterium]
MTVAKEAMTGLVSVVIPTRDRLRMLDEAIRSVRAQSYPHIELVVADYESSDGTAEYLANAGIRRIPVHRPGAGAARRAGFAHVGGEYGFFLDSDDVLEPNAIESLLPPLSQGRADLSYGQIVNFLDSESTELTSATFRHLDTPLATWISSCTLFRADVFDRFGSYEDGNASWGPWFLSARDQGLIAEYVPELVARRRIHDSNVSRLDPSYQKFFQLIRQRRQRGESTASGNIELPHAANMTTTEQHCQDLMLRACLASNDELEPAVRAWEAALDIDDIDGISMRFAPYLYRRLLAADVTARDGGILKGLYNRYWYLHHMHGAPTMRAVNEILAEVPFVVLKGLALQATVFGGDQPTRPCDDVDILVPLAYREQAYRRLTEAGFVSNLPLQPNVFLKNRPAINLLRGNEHVDLHWVVLAPTRHIGYEATLFERSVRVPSTIGELPVLAPNDSLTHTLLHGAELNDVAPIRWVLDAALLVRSGTIEWNSFVEAADEMGLSAVLLRQLNVLRDYGVVIPDNVITRLSARHSPLSIRLVDVSRNDPRAWVSKPLSALVRRPACIRATTARSSGFRSWALAHLLNIPLLLQGAAQHVRRSGLRGYLRALAKSSG